MGCSRRGAASGLCKVLDLRRDSFVHQTRGQWLKERVWPLHTSRRVPSGCTKIFESLQSRRCRRLGRASEFINAQIAAGLRAYFAVMSSLVLSTWYFCLGLSRKQQLTGVVL